MTPALLDLFNLYASAVHDQQRFLEELVADCGGWSADLEEGLIHFGDTHAWEIQVLGSYSERSETWLWAWANTQAGIPRELLQVSLYLKQLGDDKGFPELSEPKLLADDFAGHFWSVIATGLCEGCAYYRMPYEGGAAFLMIDDPAFPPPEIHPITHLATAFTGALSAYPISNHVKAFVGHARFLDLSIDIEGNTVTATDEEGAQAIATFDDKARLKSLRTTA